MKCKQIYKVTGSDDTWTDIPEDEQMTFTILGFVFNSKRNDHDAIVVDLLGYISSISIRQIQIQIINVN